MYFIGNSTYIIGIPTLTILHYINWTYFESNRIDFYIGKSFLSVIENKWRLTHCFHKPERKFLLTKSEYQQWNIWV